MFDVVSIGEVLIDFSPNGKGKMGNPSFEMNPGGAPANCLAANTKLGGSTAFIGMVGDDLFGNFLIKVLDDTGICTKGVVKTKKAATTLAFVTIDDTGDRDFAFVRKPGADFMIEKEDIDLSIIDDSKILHCGSITLSDDPGRSSQLYAMDYAKKAGKLISYDPNYRELIWNDEPKAIRMMKEALQYADIVKVSEEELAMLTGCSIDDYEMGARQILDSGKTAVFVTMGGKGSYYLTQDEHGFFPGFRVDAVDTTGCGDAFMGTIHYFFCHHPEMKVSEMVRYASAVGALCASAVGAIPALPTMQQVEDFLASRK